MITKICNTGNEHHIDTFYKIAIILADDLPKFSHLTNNNTIKEYITNLPDTAQVLITDLLPKNLSISNPTIIGSNGTTKKIAISFLLTPLDKNLQTLLAEFNNKEVIVLLSKRSTDNLYGTTLQPLLFSYSPKHSNNPSEIKGYTVSCSGETYSECIFYENIEFNIYTRGLAFELAQEI